MVFDSLSEIRLLAQSQLRYRREIFALKQYFSTRDCTVLLLDDRSSEATGTWRAWPTGWSGSSSSRPVYGAQRRRLRVVKLRGVDFRGGYHDFAIVRGGLEVFPRLVAAEHHEPFAREPMSSRPARAGRAAGRGASTAGPARCCWARPAPASRPSPPRSRWPAPRAASRSPHYAFDESLATLLARSASLGLDVARHRDSGTIAIRQIDPAEVPPGQFAGPGAAAGRARPAPRLVIIDSLNGYLNAMPDEEFLILQLHELLTYLGQRGVVTAAHDGPARPGRHRR